MLDQALMTSFGLKSSDLWVAILLQLTHVEQRRTPDNEVNPRTEKGNVAHQKDLRLPAKKTLVEGYGPIPS